MIWWTGLALWEYEFSFPRNFENILEIFGKVLENSRMFLKFLEYIERTRGGLTQSVPLGMDGGLVIKSPQTRLTLAFSQMPA